MNITPDTGDTRLPATRIARRAALSSLLAAVVLACALGAGADEIELTSGKKYKGLLVEQNPHQVVFKAVIGSGTLQMTFPRSRIRSLNVDGVMPAIPKPPPKTPATGPAPQDPAAREYPPATKNRTKAQVESLIQSIGPTKPDWWDSVPLEYPHTLDLTTWDKKKPKGFWPNKKLSNYFTALKHKPWLWKTGAKVMDHVMTINRSSSTTGRKAAEGLGLIYYLHLNDYARAAYWLRKGRGNFLYVIDCYWKLGAKRLAVDYLKQLGADRTPEGQIIKLWAEMGELETALSVAEAKARSDRAAVAYLAAGHACRFAGRFEKALSYYRRSARAATGKGDRRIRNRASASIEAIGAIGDGLDIADIHDGTYKADSIGFRGPVHVEVTVSDGRIKAVKVVEQEEDWHCSAITEVPRQIVANQGITGVDAVTSATCSSEAVINATAKALGKAPRKLAMPNDAGDRQ